MQPLKAKFLILLATIGLANFYSIRSTATPHSKEEFCQLTSDPLALKALAFDEANRLPFENHGGMGNVGTCWWHSRFQRQALYLTVFRPDLPAPSKSEVAILLRDIVSKKKVVEIPGYSNLSAFAKDFAFEIQKALTRWQRSDWSPYKSNRGG
jgi:hypothetical protein